jgi:hypothetical protein
MDNQNVVQCTTSNKDNSATDGARPDPEAESRRMDARRDVTRRMNEVAILKAALAR